MKDWEVKKYRKTTTLLTHEIPRRKVKPLIEFFLLQYSHDQPSSSILSSIAISLLCHFFPFQLI